MGSVLGRSDRLELGHRAQDAAHAQGRRVRRHVDDGRFARGRPRQIREPLPETLSPGHRTRFDRFRKAGTKRLRRSHVDADEPFELAEIAGPVFRPQLEEPGVGADGRVPPVEGALETHRPGQSRQPGELGRIIVDRRPEVDAGVSPLGQPGVAHDHEKDETVRVDQAVEDGRGELDVPAGRELDRPEAVREVVELDAALAAHDVIALVRHGVDVGRPGHLPVGGRALVVDGQVGQADAADQVLVRGLRGHGGQRDADRQHDRGREDSRQGHSGTCTRGTALLGSPEPRGTCPRFTQERKIRPAHGGLLTRPLSIRMRGEMPRTVPGTRTQGYSPLGQPRAARDMSRLQKVPMKGSG